MNYKNSSSYVQKQTNKLLRSCKNIVKIYVNDIITYSRTLKKHLAHLRQLFDLFRLKRVNFVFTKSFFEYSSIMLFDQRVNFLNMIIVKKKIAVIIFLLFSINLKNLNIFLDLTEWFRFFIERYAQRVNSLQKRKTILTRLLSTNVKKSTRRKEIVRIRFYEFTHDEQQFFKNLKKKFRSLIFLTHYDRNRKLFVDLNFFKSWSFADMIYHVKKNLNDDFFRIDVQSIMFLNRCFNETKKIIDLQS